VSDRGRATGVLLALLLAIGTAGCSYLRPALPPGMQACIDVPQSVCDDIIEGRVNDRAPVALTAYRITCKSDTCTEASGEAEFELAWADGMTEVNTYAWAG
jgi:hypothetical protein